MKFSNPASPYRKETQLNGKKFIYFHQSNVSSFV